MTAALVIWALLAIPRPAAALEASAARVDITPDLKSEKPLLAGFGATGRRPSGVHDPLFARLLVMREGGTVIALAGLDLLGFEHNDVLDLRRISGYDIPGRSLFVAATHTHSGPDTLGLWGRLPGLSGVDARYQLRIKNLIAQELKRLETELREVKVSGATGVLDPRGLCRDSRDPQIIDPNLSVLRLTKPDGGTLATVVNWSCHPEVIGRENLLVTADYPGPLCARVEEKTGGACLFLNGMIGGLMTPDTKIEDFDEMRRIGTSVADAALAMKVSPGTGLSYRSERILVPVENSRYRLALPALIFGHLLNDAQGRPLSSWKTWGLVLRQLFIGLTDKTEPWVESEVSVLRIGPALILGLPGEAFPELGIGGYGGKYSFGRTLTTPGNPDPPDVSRAPRGPYLREMIEAQVPMIVGLANDELGYMVPGYDFKVRPSKLMLPRMPGHHYEETNSIGPSVTSIVTDAAARLLKPSR